MSHELRTPLNAILGFTQVMKRDTIISTQQQEYLEIIMSSGEHLLALINDILQMSKIEAGQMTFNETTFDLYRLLESLQQMLQLKAQSKGLHLIFERSQNVPQYVKTDEGKLRQVLINLLENAIKFTTEGGVTVHVGRTSEELKVECSKVEGFRELEVLLQRKNRKVGSSQPENLQPTNLQPDNPQPENLQPANLQPENLQPANLQPANLQPANLQPENLQPENLQPENLQPANLQPENLQPENLQPSTPNNLQPANLQPANLQPSIPPITLTFEVEDTGPGIPQEEMSRLFEAFTQTETGQKSGEGTGLGLPISRKFVQLMGGDIAVSSTLGQGATFTFNIQIKLAQASDIEATQAMGQVIGLAPDQPDSRILVVEDQWASRHLLVQLLTSIGFQVREAENGQEAVVLWESWQPHLIWMDIQMPVMDGYEATKRIKAKQRERRKYLGQTRPFLRGKQQSYPDEDSSSLELGRETVIIALTASAFEEQRIAILSAGCDDLVCKPFQEEVLLSKMAEHLGVRYRYQEQQSLSLAPSDTSPKLTSEALAVMSGEWIQQLNRATAECSYDRMCELIEQIPQEYASLADELRELVNNFSFEQIIELTEKRE